MPYRNTLQRIHSQIRPQPSRAIFIVGAPRSGSALLFQLLREADQIATLSPASRRQIEAMIADQSCHDSDRLDAAAATPELVAQLTRLVRDQHGHARLLDQRGANALRVPFLSAAFPEAQFIYLYREPREQLAQMIAAWQSQQCVTRPQLPGWEGPAWSLPLIPAWQTLRDKPLAEIALAQWAAITTQLLDDLAALADERWCALSYASLLADPRATISWLGQFADLRWRSQPRAALAQARDLARGAPQHDAAVEAMLPLVAQLDRRARGLSRTRHPAFQSRQAGLPTRWPRDRRLMPQPVARALTAGSLLAGLLAAPALRPSTARAASLVVTNLNDAGAGSLRQAINTANSTAGADVITFQSQLSGTIGLTTGDLVISDTVAIQGPGPDAISVSGKHISRVFYLNSSLPAPITVAISGLTITAGSASIGGPPLGGPPFGGGIANHDQKLTLDNVVVANNAAFIGGGIFADGPAMNLTIRNSIISGNTAFVEGGGVALYSNGGPLVIQNTTITNNGAAGLGGGIFFGSLDNDMTIADSTISDNAAGGAGGGMFLGGSTVGAHAIRDTTISGNSAGDGGGFLLQFLGVPFVVENSTISGNHATAGAGGGVYSYVSYGDLTIRHSTIAGNTATSSGGGIYAYDGGATLSHVIVADNTASTNNDLATATSIPTETSVLTTSFSLIESPGNATINNQGGNILNRDPQLGPLANNGGPTQTQLPADTSPVLNAGNPAFAPPPSADQRGRPRVADGKIDLGAVERQPSVQLHLTQSAAPSPVGIGDTLTYTIGVTNTGTHPATGVVMTDTLPLGVTFVSATASQGGCSGTTALTCALGTLAVGGHATITLVVRPTKSGTIVNTAVFSSDQDNPTADNTISVSTIVRKRLFLPIVAR